MSALNGADVLVRTTEAIYIRIPDSIASECEGCCCDYCKKHPENTPRWDTLVVPRVAKHGRDWCCTVHMPDPETFRKAMRKKGRLCNNEHP
jgi:hypothetical protein